MPKFRMRYEDTGEEYTITCPIEFLQARKIGEGPVKEGDRFERISKLDDSVRVEILVGEPPPPQQMAPGFGVHNWIDTMGVNPEQIPEALAADRAMGLNTEYHPETGAVRYPDRQTRKRHCENHGFYERNSFGEGAQRLDAREREIRDPNGARL